MSKACCIKQKKTWDCKGASAKYLVKSMNTYAMYFFQTYIYIYIYIYNVCFSCDNSVFVLYVWMYEWMYETKIGLCPIVWNGKNVEKNNLTHK